ncbi:MAG: DUF255 domain-containing protein, partial [Bdellovibrionales bacterium]|nr:DUF255 domain-containing protein [Bdellovibrionales bacterium]
MKRKNLGYLCFALLVMLSGKVMAETQKTKNRLAAEKSPYLLQHQNNPVDWFPWGEEAFKAAK